MEELESVWTSASNGTVVTSRYFLDPWKTGQKHGARRGRRPQRLPRRAGLLKELRQGSCVSLVSISPGILRAAAVILHSMRGNELLMTATPDVQSRLLALLRASSHVLCDRPSMPLVEQPAPEQLAADAHAPGHCAESYLSGDTIEQLRKEIGLQTS